MTCAYKTNYPRIAKFTACFYVLSILGLWVESSASIKKQPGVAHPAPTASAAADTMDVSPADTGTLIRDTKAVLTRNYPGIDTVALIARIQERLQWGEKDDRLIEAEGILHWDRGETHLALPCFRRLSRPNPMVMGLMAEGLLIKGERYEAAALFLKAARAMEPTDTAANTLYLRFLEINPDQIKVDMELAGRLESQKRNDQAMDIYSKRQAEIALDTAATFRVGTIFTGQGRHKDATSLYALALKANPENKALWLRQAAAWEALNQKVEAAQAWIGAWNLDVRDTTARNRAIAHLEAVGAAGNRLLRPMIEKALEQDPLSAPLHFKMAVICLRSKEREAAYTHLDQALKSSPGNPTYMSRISEAIEGDSLIQIHFAYLKSESEKDNPTTRLLQQVARGYSLTGDKAKACHAWIQAQALSAQALDGRRDVFLDLAACNDAASQTLAESLGEKIVADKADRDYLRAMTQIALHNKSYAKAAATTFKLVSLSPEEALNALATAKILLTAKEESQAGDILAAIVLQTPIPEASYLLGKIQYQHKDCVHATTQLALAGEAYPDAAKMRGECLVELKDFQGAVLEYGTHFVRTGDKSSLQAQARIYRQLGDAAQELLALETLTAKNWAGEDEKLHLALLRAAQGDTIKAAVILNELFRTRTVIPQDSLWSQAALLVGNQTIHEGNCDKAIKFLGIGLKTAPTSMSNRAQVWMQIGDCQVEKSRWKDAYYAYSQGLDADPHSQDLAHAQLQAAKQMGDKAELASAYEVVYQMDPNDEGANAFLGQARQSIKDYREAAFHYRKLAEIHPEDPKILENLGNALAMIPDLPAAAVPLQSAIDLGAESDEVYINRARAFRAEGSKDMAASILSFLLSRNSQNFFAILWTAKFAEEDGNQEVATEMYKKVAKLTPPHTAWPDLANQGVLSAKISEAPQ